MDMVLWILERTMASTQGAAFSDLGTVRSLSLQRLCAAHNLQDLAGDGRLAGLVVG